MYNKCINTAKENSIFSFPLLGTKCKAIHWLQKKEIYWMKIGKTLTTNNNNSNNNNNLVE